MIWWPTEVPTLTRGLINLRKPELKDTQAVFDGCQDPLIPRFTAISADYSMAHALDYVQRVDASLRTQRELPLIIEYGNGDDRKFAGTISFHSISVKNSVGEIGYWMSESMRGKSIATTAVRMLTDYGFATIGFKRVEAMVDVENMASTKLLTSAGYQREGLLRKKISRDDGRQVDMYLFAAIPEEWEYLPE
jgi:[ribosomal protein S5]-alanine N-acetyltransferase|uniref:GNAT family N-acetyltransferase n=1 Tax=Candidatus Planktophila sp. TaxID=2175601 RepID=UPI00404A3599